MPWLDDTVLGGLVHVGSKLGPFAASLAVSEFLARPVLGELALKSIDSEPCLAGEALLEFSRSCALGQKARGELMAQKPRDWGSWLLTFYRRVGMSSWTSQTAGQVSSIC